MFSASVRPVTVATSPSMRPALQQLAQHGGHAAGAMESLAEIFSRRLHVHEQRHIAAVLHPVLRRDLDARVARHRDQMRLRVRRAADRGDRRDRVQERLARENRRRPQVFVRHLDDATAGRVRHLPALAIGRGNRGAARQRQAERFGDGVHRRSRAHRVAVAERRRGSAGGFEELLLRSISPAASLRRERQITVPEPTSSPSCQPSSIGPPESTIAGMSTVDAAITRGRRRLVAARGEHDGIDRIAVQDLDEPEIREIPIERRGRPPAVLEDRMHREFHRDAAGIADAVAHALHRLQVHAIAGREVAAGLRDADDRLAARSSSRVSP